jgi:hypothetical protein
VHRIWREKIPRMEGWQVIKQKLGQSKQGLMWWQRVNKCLTKEVIIQKTMILSFLQEEEDLPNLLEIRKLQGEVNDLLEEDELK